MNELRRNSKELKDLIDRMPREIKERCLVQKKSENNILFYKGDPLEYIYILCEGEVRVMNIFKKGSVYIVSDGGLAQFIGEQGVLAGEEYAAVTVITVSDCTFMKIHREDFLRWIDQDHEFTKYLLNKLSERLYATSKEHGIRSNYPSQYLLQRYFVKTYEKYNTNEVCIQAKRQEMADEVGISLRSVERSIENLKKENKIAVRKKKIYISKDQYVILKDSLDD